MYQRVSQECFIEDITRNVTGESELSQGCIIGKVTRKVTGGFHYDLGPNHTLIIIACRQRLNLPCIETSMLYECCARRSHDLHHVGAQNNRRASPILHASTANVTRSSYPSKLTMCATKQCARRQCVRHGTKIQEYFVDYKLCLILCNHGLSSCVFHEHVHVKLHN
jgi:hypothetical protein